MTNWFIFQSFTDHAFQDRYGSPFVVYPIGNPIVVPELEFGRVAVQVLLGAMLVDALHAPLEDREVALNRVRVDRAATHSPAE